VGEEGYELSYLVVQERFYETVLHMSGAFLRRIGVVMERLASACMYSETLTMSVGVLEAMVRCEISSSNPSLVRT
jgi:hypothetical protein